MCGGSSKPPKPPPPPAPPAPIPVPELKRDDVALDANEAEARKGRKRLRIDLTNNTSSEGSGLNIPM